MPLTRREFLWTTAAATLALPGEARAQRGGPGFAHGVASGDPLTDRVILWTRAAPSAGAGTVEVAWRVASDEALTRVVAKGTATTSAERDFTVKVDAGGLQPGRTYYYAFTSGGAQSPVGRTKTLGTGQVARVRLGVVSCANYPAGYFNPYRCLAARADLDAVLHLGDYIYEFPNAVYGDGTALKRIPLPERETVSLADYRLRYATYRTDPDLQEVHRQHPVIAVWDDHELTNDAWSGGAANHDDKTEGDWPTRRAAAYRAYLEWMPIRESAAGGIALYRGFRFGALADLTMLDTRGLRDHQVKNDDLDGLVSPDRSLLGAAQESWLFDQWRGSQKAGTAWRLLGQQIMFSPLAFPDRPVPLPDVWDGYQASRRRVVDFLVRERVRDLAILSGDVHSSWAFDVPQNPWEGYTRDGKGSFAVELVTPAVSSPPLFADPNIRQNAPALRIALPHLKFLDGERRGYLLVDVTAKRLLAEWYHVAGVAERSDTEVRGAAFACERGSGRLAPA